MLARTAKSDAITIAGLEIEMMRCGRGRPLVFLHPEIGFAPDEAVLDALAQHFDIIAPSHPGFGHSQLPDWMTTVEDLSYFYLEMLETLGLEDVILIGNAFGGWIAAELAVKQPQRLSQLVLSNPAGIKLSGREQRDLVDMFSLTADKLDALSFHDARHARHFDPKASSEDDIYVELRNRETAARFAWSPYMHNPKLLHRLRLIRLPTLVLWGESDRIAPAEYGQRFAQAIPDARFATIAQAGRYPHLEAPDAFARAVHDFAKEK